MERNLELCSLIYGKYSSVAAFARELGMSKQKLQSITSGRTEPSIQDVSAIANGLDVPVEKIVNIFLTYKSTNVGNKQQSKEAQ